MKTINKIDIVITATLRPEVLNLTFQSFCNKFLNQFDKKRLIINIDNIGDENYNCQDMLNVCYKYFDEIKYNFPEKPSFPKAVQWCWKQVESEYFLHLEDDWLLKKHIDTKHLFNLFSDDTNINYVRFFLSRNDKLQYKNNYVYSNGFSLNPAIIKTRFMKELLQNFDTNQDPEKQFNHLDSFQNGLIVFGNKNDGRWVVDIGKKWRRFKNFQKPDITKSKNKTWSNKNKKFSIIQYLKYTAYMKYWNYLAKCKK
jgi:hypothetical protein